MKPRRKPTLRDTGEEQLIRLMADWLKPEGPSGRSPNESTVLAGIGGDDVALVQVAPGAAPLALTTDMLVEGRHFLRDHPPRLLGRKAVAANLSDLASAGAQPAWLLVSLGAPADLSVQWVEELYRGMADRLAPYGAEVIGGDSVGARDRTINIVACGFLPAGVRPPLRSKAAAGQTLYCTGALGDAAMGLALLQDAGLLRKARRQAPKKSMALIDRHQDPAPRVQAGVALARACPDLAMMDLSDGLAMDLPRIARESAVGFDVRLARLPLSPAARTLGGHFPESLDYYALYGGEDFELLFATSQPPEKWKDRVRRGGGGRPLRITAIGRATLEHDGVRFVGRDGRALADAGRSYRHF